MKKNHKIISFALIIPLLLLIAGCIKSAQQIEASQPERNCDQYPTYEDCVCPEGQKKISTQVGSRCFDESVCEYFTLSDNKSACVRECPQGYLPLIITGGNIGAECVNVKQINEDNYWLYGRHILRISNLSFYNEKDCLVIDEIELEDKFEIVFMCYNRPGNCSLYIYNDTSFEFSSCSDNG